GGQSATVNTAFGSQLVAKVTDAYGNAISGATVTFAGPPSGPGVTFPSGATATTNAAGQAGVTVAANTAAGSYPVTATTGGAGRPGAGHPPGRRARDDPRRRPGGRHREGERGNRVVQRDRDDGRGRHARVVRPDQRARRPRGDLGRVRRRAVDHRRGHVCRPA